MEQSDREEEQAKEARRLDAKTTCEVVRRKAMNQLDRGNLLGGVILAAAVNHAQATSGE